jgi:hypothetical protein
MSEIANGTKVKTVKPEVESKDWVGEVLASRKWDVTGKVVKKNDEHGLCYGVRHDDGSAGWYEFRELEIMEDVNPN